VTIAKLEERLNGALTWLKILTGAFGAGFVFFLWVAWAIRGNIDEIGQNVAVQTQTINGIEKSVDRIETKLDQQTPPQQGNGAK
jgi:hypothetical protein